MHDYLQFVYGVSTRCDNLTCELYQTTDFEVKNETVSLTVPTQGSVPVISMSNWIIWMHRYVPSGFSWNYTWDGYRDGFGSSDSDDFWLGWRDCR